MFELVSAGRAQVQKLMSSNVLRDQRKPGLMSFLTCARPTETDSFKSDITRIIRYAPLIVDCTEIYNHLREENGRGVGGGGCTEPDRPRQGSAQDVMRLPTF